MSYELFSYFSSPVLCLCHAHGIVRLPPDVVHCLSDVICISHGAYSNEVTKAIFHADVSTMPGLCLLDIDGAPCIGYEIMPSKAYFHNFNFSKKLIVGASYYARILPDSRPLMFVENYFEIVPTDILAELENGQEEKMWCLVTRPLKIFYSKTAKQNS